MNNIGIKYYTSNPLERVNEESRCSKILDKIIQVSEIDENVLRFVDVKYTESATVSINNITTKAECQRVIELLETIKNNLQE